MLVFCLDITLDLYNVEFFWIPELNVVCNWWDFPFVSERGVFCGRRCQACLERVAFCKRQRQDGLLPSWPLSSLQRCLQTFFYCQFSSLADVWQGDCHLSKDLTQSLGILFSPPFAHWLSSFFLWSMSPCSCFGSTTSWRTLWNNTPSTSYENSAQHLIYLVV